MVEEDEKRPAGRGMEARRLAWLDEKWRERRLANWSKRIKRDELHKLAEYYGLLPVPF